MPPKNNLSKVFKHIEVINGELGGVKKDVAVLKNDISWIKNEINTQGKRQWGIVVSIIISIILALANLIGGA